MSDKVRLFERDLRAIAARRAAIRPVLEAAGGAPAEAQVAFIKELLKRPEEAEAFRRDPKQYTIEHGILFDPDVVRFVNNSVLFDTVIDPEVASKFGLQTLKDVVDMRESFGTGVDPKAHVVAAAAVVAAVAAVVTMVVTLVRVKRDQDIVRLTGHGPEGYRLPGKIPFLVRDPLVRAGMLRDR